MSALSWLTGVLLAAALTAPPVARAHTGDPNIQTAVERVKPSLPGVTLSVVENVAPALSAQNASTQDLEILGPDGAPFLRLGPRGAEGNVNSPAFYRSSAPGGQAPVPPRARRGPVAPAWARLSRRPAWGWYEPRVPDIPSAPDAVRTRASPTTLASWAIPLRYGARPAVVQGVVTYRPPVAGVASTLTSPTNPAAGVTVALLPGHLPDLLVSDTGPQTVTIMGEQGEPFARIGPAGVQVNVRSPIYAADVSARGGTPATASNPAAPPLFRRVSTSGTLDWFDPRPHLQSRWTVPVRIGAHVTAITGTLTLQAATPFRSPAPSHDGGGDGHVGGRGHTTVVLIAGAGALLLAAAAVRVRRRPRSPGV